MNDPEKQEVQTTSRLISRTRRAVRLHLEQFDAGLALIKNRFSTETRVAALDDETRRQDARHSGACPFPFERLHDERRKQASDPASRLGDLRTFVETRRLAMDRAEAQSVLLVIAWVADDEPDYSIGLPRLVRSWVHEHADWTGADYGERVEAYQDLHGLLRHLLGYDAEGRSRLAHVGQLAWDVMEGAGLLAGEDVAVGGLGRDGSALEPVGMFEPEHPERGVVLVHMLDVDRPRRTKATLVVGRGRRVPPVQVTVKGRTVAYLLKLVTDQPDQQHSWISLLKTGLGARYWANTSAKAMERAGRRVRDGLPAEVRGHWEQDGIGAMWRSR